jgi:hypothetical protein
VLADPFGHFDHIRFATIKCVRFYPLTCNRNAIGYDRFNVEAIGDGMTGKSDEWASIAKRHLKSEMVKADVRFAELAKRLTDMGLPETEASVQLKINRGTFPAWFFFAVMKALDVHVLRLHEAD